MNIDAEQQKLIQRMQCVYSKVCLSHFAPFKPCQSSKMKKRGNNQKILQDHLANLSHKKKKPNQKLVNMQFLKNSKMAILGYNKASERGDINFIDASQPKLVEFFYNQLQGGLGGIGCFEDAQKIMIADRKGAFTFIDLVKALNIEDIKNKVINTQLDGVMDFSIAPSQTKVVCGLSDKRCVVVDIQNEKELKKFPIQKKFQRHVHGVNSIMWHPYQSLVISSSIDLNDMLRLWDPHSEELIHETKFHKNIITKSMFHPNGVSYFSLGKDNLALEYDLRFKGILNRFSLNAEPSHLQVTIDGTVAISDFSGAMNWFSKDGSFIKSNKGSYGIGLFAIDQTGDILLVAREREHMFDIYTKRSALDFSIQQMMC